jgi:hypothetical protein
VSAAGIMSKQEPSRRDATGRPGSFLLTPRSGL